MNLIEMAIEETLITPENDINTSLSDFKAYQSWAYENLTVRRDI